jgi:hypothetical protein
MGIRTEDCEVVAQALGERIGLNEFDGYLAKASIDPRGFPLATYALRGLLTSRASPLKLAGLAR